VAVDEQARTFTTRAKIVRGAGDCAWVVSDQDVPTRLDGLRPLRTVAKGDAGTAGEVRLLLHPAGVGHDRLRVLFQDQHLEVAHWIDQHQVLGRFQPGGRQGRAGAGMDGKNDPAPRLADSTKDSAQQLRLVEVLGTVHGQQRVAVSLETELGDDATRLARDLEVLLKGVEHHVPHQMDAFTDALARQVPRAGLGRAQEQR